MTIKIKAEGNKLVKSNLTYILMGLFMLTVARVDAATIFAPTDGDVNFLIGDLQGNILAMFDNNDQSFLGNSCPRLSASQVR